MRCFCEDINIVRVSTFCKFHSEHSHQTEAQSSCSLSPQILLCFFRTTDVNVSLTRLYGSSTFKVFFIRVLHDLIAENIDWESSRL